MAERKLRLSPDLALPLDVAGEAIGILATRGAGKSYTSAVLVEELHAAGVQLVVLDPTGVYWGLRSSADGRSEGLPLSILGGAHGDVSLEPTAGRLIADVIVDTGSSLILDLSDFESKGAQTRFIADLAERLYHRKARSRTTLHLVIDEANEFAPQRPMRDEPRMLGAIERIVGKGRSRGIGVTLITQRSAALNKNVLDLVETLVAMRVLGPRDRKAIDGWITVKETSDDAGVLASLPSLPTGTAWVWAPVRGILQRAAIRRIRTFDSYETPKPGVERAEPSAVAPIDLSKLGEQIRATAERAEASDPRKLQARIRELEADAQRTANKITAPPEPERIIERVEVPVLNGQVERLEAVVGDLRQIGEGMVMAGTGLAGVADSITAAIEKVAQSDATVGRVAQAPRAVPARPAGDRAHTAVATPAPAARPQPAPIQGDISIGKGERTILVAVAQYPGGAARDQLSVLTGYKRSSRNTYLQRLLAAGYVESAGADHVRATEAGIAALGSDYEPLPQGRALQDYWRARLPVGERRVFDVLVAAYPDTVAREQIDEQTGYRRSSRNTYLQRLRSRRLVDTVGSDEVRASEDLF
jgi:hypothetical protein